ncbi:hypothetical protein Unana1_04839 [Umbelopsis nana]
MDNPTTLSNNPIGDGSVAPPSIVVNQTTEMIKDTVSIDQTRSSIRSYGAPLGSVDTPSDSFHDKNAVDSIHEATEDYAPSASLQVHAGKDDESSLSEVDSAAAIRHKPWTSGHTRAEEHDGRAAAVHPTSRRLSDADEKVQAWLKSTEEPDSQANAQDDDLGPQQRQRRRSTIQALKSHLLHGKFGVSTFYNSLAACFNIAKLNLEPQTGLGKWIGKNDGSNRNSQAVPDGKQELELLKNGNSDTNGLGK